MSNLKGEGLDERTEIYNSSGRGQSKLRGRLIGRRGGRARGKGNTAHATFSTGGQEDLNSMRLRPTHFLAFPLNIYSSLMNQITTFQRALFSNVDGCSTSQSTPSSKVINSSLVGGLDSSIIIDPRRLHMTLGVMALEQDDGSAQMPTEGRESTVSPQELLNSVSITGNLQPPASTFSSIGSTPTSLPASQFISSDYSLDQSQSLLSPASPPTTSLGQSPKKTVSTALDLLNSLKPRISELLEGDKGIKIPLEVLHVLKTEKMWINTKKKRRGDGDTEEASGGKRNKDTSPCNPGPYNDHTKDKETIGAGVLYVAPDIKNQNINTDLHKLIQVSNFVHQAFKEAGYLTDTRPLKLHCTILNTSHRKPRFRQPFSYSDILVSDALRALRGDAGDSNSQSILPEEGSSSIPEHELGELIVQEGKSSGSNQCNLSMSVLQPSSDASKSKPNPKSLNVPVVKNPPSVSLNLGVFVVEEVQLWVMGSHGPNNEYVSCGGILLE